MTREPETCVRITGRPAASASPPLNGSWPGRAYVGRPYANPMAELPGVCLDDLGPLLAGRAGVGRKRARPGAEGQGVRSSGLGGLGVR